MGCGRDHFFIEMQQLYHAHLVISSGNDEQWARALAKIWHNGVSGVDNGGLLFLLDLPKQKILYIGID